MQAVLDYLDANYDRFLTGQLRGVCRDFVQGEATFFGAL